MVAIEMLLDGRWSAFPARNGLTRPSRCAGIDASQMNIATLGDLQATTKMSLKAG